MHMDVMHPLSENRNNVISLLSCFKKFYLVQKSSWKGTFCFYKIPFIYRHNPESECVFLKDLFLC